MSDPDEINAELRKQQRKAWADNAAKINPDKQGPLDQGDEPEPKHDVDSRLPPVLTEP